MPAWEDFHDSMGPLAAVALVGYFLGALPFGYLVAKSRGVDIFKQGSGSSGATNVRRLLGARAGNTVFVLDALKGALAAGWPLFFAWEPKLLGLVGLVFAMFGHSFSCFTGFRGGKGVATGAGGFLVLLPFPTLISAGVWIGVFFLSRYVSLASICSALALPTAAWALGLPPSWLTTVSAIVCAFVIWRHRANIVRLLNGTESRWTVKLLPGEKG